jgi:hypothetical protein
MQVFSASFGKFPKIFRNLGDVIMLAERFSKELVQALEI